MVDALPEVPQHRQLSLLSALLRLAPLPCPNHCPLTRPPQPLCTPLSLSQSPSSASPASPSSAWADASLAQAFFHALLGYLFHALHSHLLLCLAPVPCSCAASKAPDPAPVPFWVTCFVCRPLAAPGVAQLLSLLLQWASQSSALEQGPTGEVPEKHGGLEDTRGFMLGSLVCREVTLEVHLAALVALLDATRSAGPPRPSSSKSPSDKKRGAAPLGVLDAGTGAGAEDLDTAALRFVAHQLLEVSDLLRVATVGEEEGSERDAAVEVRGRKGPCRTQLNLTPVGPLRFSRRCFFLFLRTGPSAGVASLCLASQGASLSLLDHVVRRLKAAPGSPRAAAAAHSLFESLSDVLPPSHFLNAAASLLRQQATDQHLCLKVCPSAQQWALGVKGSP